ncbi:hypothetical protein NE237_032885 [Protea cynaroides]|uniref:Uncharacterized protein n=1 Tax=Protea cynaroides TaxID=273540 RepID=A0A9Q0R3H8_9MAGN|nr:hypothetical protein NE237_032885 [Protea cynaroides]
MAMPRKKQKRMEDDVVTIGGDKHELAAPNNHILLPMAVQTEVSLVTQLAILEVQHDAISPLLDVPSTVQQVAISTHGDVPSFVHHDATSLFCNVPSTIQHLGPSQRSHSPMMQTAITTPIESGKEFHSQGKAWVYMVDGNEGGGDSVDEESDSDETSSNECSPPTEFDSIISGEKEKDHSLRTQICDRGGCSEKEE